VSYIIERYRFGMWVLNCNIQFTIMCTVLDAALENGRGVRTGGMLYEV
jgi:hypothetical protein